MPTNSKRSAALLLTCWLLTACATSPQPSPVQMPQPAAELMQTHETPLSESVPALLSRWTRTLQSWLDKLEHCRTTPSACV